MLCAAKPLAACVLPSTGVTCAAGPASVLDQLWNYGLGLNLCFVLCCPAAPVLLHHIPAIMSTCLSLASGHSPAASATAPRRTSTDEQQQHAAGSNGVSGDSHDPREAAAAAAALAVALAADEESVHVLVSELLKGLEDVAGRAQGTAQLIAAYARSSKQDLQPHVDDLLTVSCFLCQLEPPYNVTGDLAV